jgi:hypothetical protein
MADFYRTRPGMTPMQGFTPMQSMTPMQGTNSGASIGQQRAQPMMGIDPTRQQRPQPQKPLGIEPPEHPFLPGPPGTSPYQADLGNLGTHVVHLPNFVIDDPDLRDRMLSQVRQAMSRTRSPSRADVMASLLRGDDQFAPPA